MAYYIPFTYPKVAERDSERENFNRNGLEDDCVDGDGGVSALVAYLYCKLALGFNGC